jgi:peptide/nickel transport system substrate-binding protein
MESYWNRFIKARVARRRLLAGSAAVGLGASALALVGCGGDDDGGGGTDSGGGTSTGTGSTAAGEPQTGGTYGTHYTTSDTLNILTNASEYAAFGGQYVYDHLITTRTNANAPYVLEAASGLEQPDQITLTFKLRPGMKFHNFPPVNGREVVAEDVKKTQEFITPQSNIENNFQKNFLDRVETPDKSTVVYKLKEPRAYLFDSRILGHPGPQAIIPFETFDKLASDRQIGSGPFMLDQWVISTRYHYVRNPEYHSRGKKGLPYRDATDVFVLTDAAALDAAFRSQQIHFWTNPTAGQYDELATSLGSMAKKLENTSLSPFTWNMNMTKAPFTDQRFRQAMYRVTNRQQFIDLVYKGKAEKPTGILATTHKNYQLDAKDTDAYFKFDPAEAKQLLSAMNWDSNKEVELFFISPNSTTEQAAEVFRQQAAAGGIKFRIVSFGLAEALPRTQRNEYEMFIGGHPGYDTPSVPMRHNHSNPIHQFAVSGLKDPEMDALIEKAEKTTNFEENVKLVKQAQLELIKRYTSYYNILTPISRQFLNSKIENFEWEASNTAMHRADLWFKKG